MNVVKDRYHQHLIGDLKNKKSNMAAKPCDLDQKSKNKTVSDYLVEAYCEGFMKISLKMT